MAAYVSTSKPGESLCGNVNVQLHMTIEAESQPPSLENPFVGKGLQKETRGKKV